MIAPRGAISDSEIVVLAGAGAVAVGLAFFASAWLPAAGLGATALAGLFRFLRPQMVCRNPVRRAILRFVQEGVANTPTALADALGVSRQTIAYHLNVLAEFHAIHMVRDGRCVRVLPRQDVREFSRPIRLLEARPWAKRVLHAVHDDPEASVSSLARRLDVSRSTMRWYLDKLDEYGVLQRDISRQDEGVYLAEGASWAMAAQASP